MRIRIFSDLISVQENNWHAPFPANTSDAKNFKTFFGQVWAHISQANNKETKVKYVIDPTRIYLFRVNNENSRTMCGLCLKLTIKRHQRDTSDVVLVTCLLALKRFRKLFWYFYCWLWASTGQLGRSSIRLTS